MYSLDFQQSGWLNRYFSFRSSTPIALPKSYLDFAKEDLFEEKFDELLYAEVKGNGMIYGCPVISSSLLNLAKKLNFPKHKGGTILLFLETLFSIALIENESLTSTQHVSAQTTYQTRLLKIVLMALRYYLPGSYFRIKEDVPFQELLVENETLNGALKQLEEVFLNSITLQGYSSLGNRQNNFAFPKLYFFLLWARSKAKNETSDPANFVAMDKHLREEMIITFAALIWADDYLDNIEQQVIDKYIEQTGLQESKQDELTRRILEPVKIDDIQCSYTSGITSRYLVEQLILLSLIDNQGAWQERELIEKVSQRLGLSSESLEQLYFSVAEFFSVHNKRLEFLKNNNAAQQFQDYMNDKVLKLVRKNVDNIMKEIKETQELSELLVKATTKPLTNEEKQKVQEQLMDIAKSIPALAIFALPGGGILLPILIKVLPFNILPSSFQDELHSNQELSQ